MSVSRLDSVNESDLRKIYGLSAAFGPERAVPLRNRAANALPHLNEGQVDAAVELVQALEQRAFELACSVWDDVVTRARAESLLSREFPQFGGSCASRAIGQAIYFAAK